MHTTRLRPFNIPYEKNRDVVTGGGTWVVVAVMITVGMTGKVVSWRVMVMEVETISM